MSAIGSCTHTQAGNAINPNIKTIEHRVRCYCGAQWQIELHALHLNDLHHLAFNLTQRTGRAFNEVVESELRELIPEHPCNPDERVIADIVLRTVASLWESRKRLTARMFSREFSMVWGNVGRRRLERIIVTLVRQDRLELLPGKNANGLSVLWLAPKQAGISGAMRISVDEAG